MVHKAQTVLQNNAKFEAELLHLREELSEAEANRSKLEAEKKYLVCRLQSALLDNHKLSKTSNLASGVSSDEKDDKVCKDIMRRLSDEMSLIKKVDWTGSKLEERCKRLEQENSRLRLGQVELESELVGARLDSKYLDKELAGRIQQIQILLAGGGTSQDLKQKVWAQIESEMHLQRSKTISNMCYSKQKVKDSHSASARSGSSDGVANNAEQQQQQQQDRKMSSSEGNNSRFKQVHIHKSDAEELGMAILGGSEHALPIMISEVYPDTAVGR